MVGRKGDLRGEQLARAQGFDHAVIGELRGQLVQGVQDLPDFIQAFNLDGHRVPLNAVGQPVGAGDHEDPNSRLFMSATGEGFKITRYGNADQRRFLCRPILEAYRKLFRYGDLRGVTALAVRRSVVARLYERGADEDAVGLILGISERSAVRELLARHKPTVEQLLNELV